MKIFFSYSHKDERLRDKLATHLKLMQREGLIQSWYDRQITAGSEWADQIDENLNNAQIILLLISADFLASDYCYDIEMRRAIERHETGEACVIPIILKPVDWSSAPFGKLQALPKNAKPVTTWKPQDEAFLNVAQGIRKAVKEFKDRSPEITEDKAYLSSQNVSVKESETDQNPLVNLENIEIPEGQVPLDSPFYVERPPIEVDCYQAIIRPSALIRVKAPRQMGKTSLMERILDYGKQQGYEAVRVNFQLADAEFLTNLDQFLQWFCAMVTDELNYPDQLETYWKGMLGSNRKCTNYFQRYLLTQFESPLVLGLDEVDRIFQYPTVAQDFFGLLRTWHEDGKNQSIWQKVRLVIVHSKEVYIPLNINQSPFNVGLPIDLPELNLTQIGDLVKRHGLIFSEDEVNRLMEMCGGHPYLIRGALYQISRKRMTLEDLLKTAPTEEGIYADHLRRHLLNLEGDPELLEAFKQVIAVSTPIQIESSAAFKLRSMGLVSLQGNKVLPLCDLYRRYFGDRLG